MKDNEFFSTRIYEMVNGFAITISRYNPLSKCKPKDVGFYVTYEKDMEVLTTDIIDEYKHPYTSASYTEHIKKILNNAITRLLDGGEITIFDIDMQIMQAIIINLLTYNY